MHRPQRERKTRRHLTPQTLAPLAWDAQVGAGCRRLAAAARHGLIGAGALLSPACVDEPAELDPGSESGLQGAPTLEPGSSSAAGTTHGSSGRPTGDGESPTGTTDDGNPRTVRFDVGTLPDIGLEGPSSGCGAVDFLFVVDNSGSMQQEQFNLVSNFPVFIEGIESALGVDSFHVGVTTTDEFTGNPPGCRDLGSLVVADCGPYAEGANYMTDADYLHVEFTCAARVGIQGSPLERPMAAMENAINGSLAGPGQCNEGFLREDALLVVVVLTDEWDGPNDPEGTLAISTSPGDPSSWYQAVVDAKGGRPENAAAVVLTNYENGPCAPSQLYPDDRSPESYDGRNLVEFAQLFGANGFVDGICVPDWGPIFDQAIDVIDAACDGFTSPG